MGQKINTREIRKIYFSEIKRSTLKHLGKTVFVLLMATISIFLADAATNQDLNNSNPNFRV